MSSPYSSKLRKKLDYGHLRIVVVGPGGTRAYLKELAVAVKIGKVHECNNASEALVLMGQFPTDLVIYSNGMRTDAQEFCRMVRRAKFPPGVQPGKHFDHEIPIVVVEGEPDQAFKRTLNLLGASAIVPVRMSQDQFLEMLDTVVYDLAQSQTTGIISADNLDLGEFTFDMEQHGPDLVVHCQGYFCHKNRKRLDDLLDGISKAVGVRQVVLVLSDLEFIDFHAIGNLMVMDSMLAAHEIGLVLVADNPFIRSKILPLGSCVPVLAQWGKTTAAA